MLSMSYTASKLVFLYLDGRLSREACCKSRCARLCSPDMSNDPDMVIEEGREHRELEHTDSGNSAVWCQLHRSTTCFVNYNSDDCSR